MAEMVKLELTEEEAKKEEKGCGEAPQPEISYEHPHSERKRLSLPLVTFQFGNQIKHLLDSQARVLRSQTLLGLEWQFRPFLPM